MLSIEHCKKRLEQYGRKYTDEQVKEIRDLLYFFAKLDRMNYEAGMYDKRIQTMDDNKNNVISKE